jgi:hypothetical protein
MAELVGAYGRGTGPDIPSTGGDIGKTNLFMGAKQLDTLHYLAGVPGGQGLIALDTQEG